MKLLQTGMAPNRPTTFDFPKKISRKRLCTSEGSARVPTPASKCQEVGAPKNPGRALSGLDHQDCILLLLHLVAPCGMNVYDPSFVEYPSP